MHHTCHAFLEHVCVYMYMAHTSTHCLAPTTVWGSPHVDAQEAKREQMEEQRRAAAAARQEIKEDRKPKQGAAGPAPSMALRTAASLQRALSNDDDGMFWDYGPAVSQRGMAPPYCLLVSLRLSSMLTLGFGSL